MTTVGVSLISFRDPHCAQYGHDWEVRDYAGSAQWLQCRVCGEDAPADLPEYASGEGDLPPELRAELRELGL